MSDSRYDNALTFSEKKQYEWDEIINSDRKVNLVIGKQNITGEEPKMKVKSKKVPVPGPSDNSIISAKPKKAASRECGMLFSAKAGNQRARLPFAKSHEVKTDSQDGSDDSICTPTELCQSTSQPESKRAEIDLRK